MKNSDRLMIYHPDFEDGLAQGNVPIPDDGYSDGGPSFECIRKEAGMAPDVTLELIHVTLGANRVPAIMFVDEDALSKDHIAYNTQASKIAGVPIVGVAVVWQGQYED